MKHPEFKPCLSCGQGVMHSRNPVFYRLKIEHMIINSGAVQRAAGLEQMVGSPAIAFHMGPQEDLAAPLTTAEFLLCFDCATNEQCVAELLERGAKP